MWPLTRPIHCPMPDSLDPNSGPDAVMPNLYLHPDTESCGSNTFRNSPRTLTLMIQFIRWLPQSLEANARIVHTNSD
jgi:hypothetical protein